MIFSIDLNFSIKFSLYSISCLEGMVLVRNIRLIQPMIITLEEKGS